MKKTGRIVFGSAITALCLTVAGILSYTIVSYTRNDETHDFEAVVINNDGDFNKTVSYTAELVPGFDVTQSFKVESLMIHNVTFDFKFTADEGDDLSGLGLSVKIGDADSIETTLADAVRQKTLFEGSLAPKSEVTVEFKYSLSASYDGNVDGWDFDIVFNARRSLV